MKGVTICQSGLLLLLLLEVNYTRNLTDPSLREFPINVKVGHDPVLTPLIIARAHRIS